MWDISTAFASTAMYAEDPKIVNDPRLGRSRRTLGAEGHGPE